jgi:DNA-binding NarL/FixJ family response regulator
MVKSCNKLYYKRPVLSAAASLSVNREQLMIQVLVAAHQLTFDAIALLLISDVQFKFTRAPQAPAALILAAAELAPNAVILLDPAFLKGSATIIVKRLRLATRTARILICSSAPDDSLFASLIQAGATGYLGANASPTELAKALQAVSDGKPYLDESLMAQVACWEVMTQNLEPHRELSKRELEVFLHLIRGRSVGEIALLLHLSSKTISTYKGRLMSRLRVSTLSELVCYAVSHKLLDPCHQNSRYAVPQPGDHDEQPRRWTIA